MNYFSDAELTCKCGCGLLPTPAFRVRLNGLRVAYGKPLVVSSGSRCPEYNARVSGTGLTGPHTKDACDFAIFGAAALKLIGIAISLEFTGIGVSQKGPQSSRFIHVDDLPSEEGQPRPWVWSY